jgi:glycine oxidase
VVLKVVIAGAGVMGLMLARELAETGVRVCLLDKSEAGREASWAGGGIISPLYPWRYPQAVTALAGWSQQYYPELIAALYEQSGIDPELSEEGLLMLHVKDAVEAKAWSANLQKTPAQHAPNTPAWLQSISDEKLGALEPNIALADAHKEQALWMPRVASVRNPRLLKALKNIAYTHPRIEVKEKSELISFQEKAGGVSISLACTERIEADKMVVCAGAWSARVLNLPTIQVAPVKGQMLLFDAPRGLLNRVVLSDGRYLIPRRDGKIVAGSTLEYADFDKQTTEDALDSLRQSALTILPALARCPVIKQWAGLRPGSPNGVPYIGKVPGYKQVFINSGHFRNGLVLAPASVRLMRTLLNNETPPFDAEPYGCERPRTRSLVS